MYMVNICIWTPVRFAVCLGLLHYLTLYRISCMILELRLGYHAKVLARPLGYSMLSIKGS